MRCPISPAPAERNSVNALALELLGVAKEYLGPAAPAFLSRELHALGVTANTVDAAHVLPLAERARQAAAKVMDNKKAGEFAQALAKRDAPGLSSRTGARPLATSRSFSRSRTVWPRRRARRCRRRLRPLASRPHLPRPQRRGRSPPRPRRLPQPPLRSRPRRRRPSPPPPPLLHLSRRCRGRQRSRRSTGRRWLRPCKPALTPRPRRARRSC